MCVVWPPTIGILGILPRIVVCHAAINDVAQLFVEIDGHDVGFAYKEVDKVCVMPDNGGEEKRRASEWGE